MAPLNDPTETRAIHTVFGEHAPKLQISSTKAYYGHALGASGAIETAICALALERDWLPPTLNFETPAADCPVNVSAEPRTINSPYAVKLNFTDMGQVAAVVLRRWEE